MNGYPWSQILQRLIVAAIFVLFSVAFCVWFVWHEVSLERSYHQKFGDDWRTHYETDQGPLRKAHRKIAVAVLGVASITAITIWLVRDLTNKQPKIAKEPPHSYGSSIERIIHYRRNAFIGVLSGTVGILLSLVLILFHVGLSIHHDNERAIGILVFMAGYLGLITGCWWWAKAKGWNEAIVFIGLLPVAVLLIPAARRVFLASPLVLPVGMVMAPIILTVVVAALPDKSGLPPHKRWRLRP